MTGLSLALFLVSFSTFVLGLPRVDLGYATYEGAAQSNGQNQFLGIRFAAPPLGNLRFRKPQPPAKNTTIQQAKDFGPICLPTGGDINNSGNEDCLFLNLWAPSNATKTSKLPVFFYIQGGGYISNAGPNFNGSGLVSATGNKLVFVGINYRVGAFGFLASKNVSEDGDLNVGLLDQRQALIWVQDHISSFGGDPDHVVIVGISAGAGSVAMHLISYNGAPTKLFVGGIGMSPFFPYQPRVCELEWQFDQYVSKVGCSSSPQVMSCLRNAPISVLQAANSPQTYPSRDGQALWGFTPTIDGELIVDFPFKMIGEGRFVKVPVIFSDDTDEGTIFAPNASSSTEVADFFKNNYPKLSTTEADAINSIYPLQSPLPKHAAYFPSAAAAYGESTFTCPGILLSAAFAKHTQSWNYRFNVLTPAEEEAGIGVAHASEIPLLFGPGNTPVPFDIDDISLIPILQQYYTSFVRTLDPNTYTVNGSVHWPQSRSGKRLLLQVNATTVEDFPLDQLRRCEFWDSLAGVMEQ